MLVTPAGLPTQPVLSLEVRQWLLSILRRVGSTQVLAVELLLAAGVGQVAVRTSGRTGVLLHGVEAGQHPWTCGLEMLRVLLLMLVRESHGLQGAQVLPVIHVSQEVPSSCCSHHARLPYRLALNFVSKRRRRGCLDVSSGIKRLQLGVLATVPRPLHRAVSREAHLRREELRHEAAHLALTRAREAARAVVAVSGQVSCGGRREVAAVRHRTTAAALRRVWQRVCARLLRLRGHAPAAAPVSCRIYSVGKNELEV